MCRSVAVEGRVLMSGLWMVQLKGMNVDYCLHYNVTVTGEVRT